MNKKHFLLGMLSGASLVLAVLVIVFALAAGVMVQFSAIAIRNAASKTEDSAGIDLNEIDAMLEEIKSQVDASYLNEVDPQAVADGVYSGFVDALGDKYAHYYSVSEVQSLQDKNSGSFVGIGVVVSQDPETMNIYVLYVYTNSPANEAGMQIGDVICGVNGTDVLGMELNDVVSMIRGESGTEVTVKVLRGEQEVEMTMARRAIVVDTVQYGMLEDGVGYIQLVQFESVTAEQTENAINALKEQGMKKLILDLRDNPGGLLDSVVEVAGMFIDSDVVLYQEDKNGQRQYFYADAGTIFEGPIVVLVNGNSASAAEVLTASLQDYGLATILGTTNFGKGIVQTLYPLSDGAVLKFTTAHYYTPNGRDIHGVGIEPDVVLEYQEDAEGGTDNQLEAALNLIRDMETETAPEAESTEVPAA